MNFQIQNSTEQDIPHIFSLYTHASNHQRLLEKVVVWPSFSNELVATEVREGRQFKGIIDNTIVCVWAVAFKDPQIWEERDRDPSIYIHRIATHPDFRGLNMVKRIVEWAKSFAVAHKKTHVRLDTLGNNTRLISHYKAAGFDFLGMFEMKNTDGLPKHYHNNPVCLFEIKL